jgi:hypothetical protein
MKRLRCVLLLALLSLTVSGQTSHGSEKGPPRRRTVTLETVLSCLDDSLIDDVFKTDLSDAGRLNPLAMVLQKDKTEPGYLALRAKQFVTYPDGDFRYEIWPTDYLGKTMDWSKLQFCHDRPTAYYQVENETLPHPVHMVTIDGDDWFLNPNEVFAHADQFHFESGVFTNSSGVFFIAVKGRVSIQFVCKPDGLKFQRAIYTPKE